MVEDAALEERLSRLCHPIARRYSKLGHRSCADRELPEPNLLTITAGTRTTDSRDLCTLWIERSADRTHRPRNTQARLLLPITTRSSLIRSGLASHRSRFCGHGLPECTTGN